MPKTHDRVLRISPFVLLLGAGLCLALESSDAVASRKTKDEYLAPEQVRTALESIARKDFSKAESLEMLHRMDPDRFTEDEIIESLRWLEKKGAEGEQRAAKLKQLWKEDRPAFGVMIRDLVEGEILESARDQNRAAIREGIFGTIGGLGLFLFGMGLMSDGLKKAAGQKLKSLLEVLT
ncbi:MAG: hypothetical protein JSW59_15965, partial [Phycisphaerales bacterium]